MHRSEVGVDFAEATVVASGDVGDGKGAFAGIGLADSRRLAVGHCERVADVAGDGDYYFATDSLEFHQFSIQIVNVMGWAIIMLHPVAHLFWRPIESTLTPAMLVHEFR